MTGSTLLNSVMSQWLPQLLQLSDATFPTGSYAHSLGLEGIVQRGLVNNSDTLEKYIAQIIVPTLAHVDLPFVIHAYRNAAHNKIESLCKLDQQCGAMKSTRELRRACASVGKQRLQTLLQVMECTLLSAIEDKRLNGEMKAYDPIIFGSFCAKTSTPLQAAASAYYYQVLASLVSASLKLIRIGQIACQRILTHSLQKTSQIVHSALAIKVGDIGWFTPTLDIASSQHETAYTRLFIS